MRKQNKKICLNKSIYLSTLLNTCVLIMSYVPQFLKKKKPKFGFKMYISGNYNQLHEMIITGEYVIVILHNML